MNGAGKESGSHNGAPWRLIGCALVFTGGLNALIAIRSGAQAGPISYIFTIAGASLLLYGVLSRTKI